MRFPHMLFILKFNFVRNGYSHVVVVPLYPHFCCAQTGFLLNEVERSLQTFTVASAIDGREVPCERIMPNTSNSFRVSALHRWGNHPVLSEVSFYVKKS